ncbi:MAG: hypothetical protein JSR34_12175 [Proteobacteria bacterium]|nr:hypothetical protein [Pseudomonadota bacterium]
MKSLQSACEDETLLALRRSLWQLAFAGMAAAVVIAQLLPTAGVAAAWCALAPLAALATHYRDSLLLRSTR